MNRRSAYVFLPLVVVLGVSLAVLGFIYGSNAPVKVTPNGSYSSGNKYGALFGGAVFALFMVWRAGRFAERRGAGSANAVFGGILLLANLALGINAYRVTLGKPAANATVAGGPPSKPAVGSAAPKAGSQQTDREVPWHASPPLPDYVKNHAERQKRPPEQTAPTTADRPEVIAGAPTPGSAAVPRPAVKENEQDPKAQPVLDAARAMLMESAKLSADAAEGLMRIVEKPPAHDKRVLKNRAADEQVLRMQLMKTSKEMREVPDGVEKELVETGVESFEAARLSHQFMREIDAHSKAFACERLLMLCNHVRDECALLDQNFAAWSLVKGEIAVRDTKNSKLRHELTKERFFIESGCKQLPEAVKTLRGQ